MNILITGCRRGIGKSVGVALSKKHKVYLTTHHEEDTNLLKKELGKNENIEIFKLDINLEEDLDKIKTLDIDILINNAAENISGSVLDVGQEELKKIYQTNVFSQVRLMQTAFETMQNKNLASIVNISSIGGVIPFKYLGVYGSTKSSLSFLTHAMRKEAKHLNKNIKIKLVEIGAYYTGFNQDMANNNTSKKSNAYFNNYCEGQIKSLHRFFNKHEVKNLKRLTKKISKIAVSKRNKFRFRMPIIQSIGGKLFEIFLK